MKLKGLFSLIALFTCFFIQSQTVYVINYKLEKVNDTTAYQAFLVKYDDGGGFIRVKYQSPENGEWCWVEMNGQELYPDISVDITDTTQAVYAFTNPQIKKGTNTFKYPVLTVLFKKSQVTGLLEPSGITVNEVISENNLDLIIKNDLVNLSKIQKEKNKNFVEQFFNRQDVFYKNIFASITRGPGDIDKNTRLILLVVANINDKIIGTTCLYDKNRMLSAFKSVAEFLKIKFEPQIIAGDNYNKKNVEESIKALNPQPNRDIVVFYFSGHGFRKENDTRQFPYIDLRPKNDNTYMVNSKNLEDIFTEINEKKAKLTLVLSDCCNSEVTATNAAGKAIAGTRGFDMFWNPDNAKALFLPEKPMSYLATSAAPGELANGNPELGGYFTYFFKFSLESHLSYFKKNVTWTQVFENAELQTKQKANNTRCSDPGINPPVRCIQRPIVIPK